MTRVELKDIAHNWIDGLIKDKEFITAVEAYSAASNSAKLSVSGRSEQLPKSYLAWLTNAEREAGTQAELLKNAGSEHSADCSGAMAFAYRYSRETYEKVLSGNCL